jgi:GPH family glycoside/pentoside/hexuronide:cation symporter
MMPPTNQTPTRYIVGYSFGEGAFSLTMNTISGFAMFFYTQALGIKPELTAWILAIPMIWSAVADPVMGYISDTTQSRFGRRHPHILIGGVLMAVFYFFNWYVPEVFQTTQKSLVMYLIAVNLILRTLMVWYYVPYVALGFEICTDYNHRNKLQSARFVMNSLSNLIFCGIIVWRVFLVDARGNRDTTIQSNYATMGFWFGIVILVFILITVFMTRPYSTDTRHQSAHIGSGFRGFSRDMVDILKDTNSTLIFLFYGIVSCSFVFVCSLQIYIYVSFMDLSAMEASVVHSSGMIGFAIGSLIAVPIAKKLDKKPALYIGSAINIGANVCLGLFFLTGLLKPHMLPFWKTSVAGVVFWIFQASYWLGTGLILPIVFSMLADISEINRLKTGQVKDGSYLAVSGFLSKMTSAAALIAVGKLLALAGYVEGTDIQPPTVALKLTQMMIYTGIFFTAAAVLFLLKYPISRQTMEKIRVNYGGIKQ